ncbi:MAG: CBS domain-containing protein, partial [Wenyingzhuangia sp.]
EISDKRLGATVVLDQKELVGFITDGDIRRMLNNSDDFLSLTAKDIMSTKPKVIQYDAMAIEALQIMEDHNISQLIAIDKKDSYKGIIHLHDLMKEGVF